MADKDTDCGSKVGVPITIPKKNTSDYAYRYIIEDGKEICLTPDIIGNYIGKEVWLRSPMTCLGIGPNRCICNKCGGDFYYMLGKKNIGLISSKVATACTRLNMKKFHENLIKTQEIDIDDIFLYK